MNSGRPAADADHSPRAPRPRLEVVAAVIQREDGRFLLGQRPAGKVYAGYWEFPGGKVERGEAAGSALRRELLEELGIQAERFYPWLIRDYDYAHADVRLRFFRVTGWTGTLHGRENQRFAWQAPGAISVEPVLPANGPILRALQLPSIYAISNVAELGEAAFLQRLDTALGGGLRMVQLREKTQMPEALEAIATRAIAIARDHGARVLLNGEPGLARRLGADGVHLTSAALAQLRQRPQVDWVGASCHDADELARAQLLGADFAVLGPVRPTPSHPGAAGMGWERFAALIRDCALPVYALGGLTRTDLERAWTCGAHGVALMRDAWRGA